MVGVSCELMYIHPLAFWTRWLIIRHPPRQFGSPQGRPHRNRRGAVRGHGRARGVTDRKSRNQNAIPRSKQSSSPVKRLGQFASASVHRSRCITPQPPASPMLPSRTSEQRNQPEPSWTHSRGAGPTARSEPTAQTPATKQRPPSADHEDPPPPPTSPSSHRVFMARCKYRADY